MRFDPSTISAEKRTQWAAVESEWRPPVRDFEEFNGRRLLWFEGAEIFVDGYVWAEYYGLEEVPSEVSEHATRLLGEVRVIFDEPFL